MARIRVNTEDLQIKAKDFESAADAFNQAGDDIASTAMEMPSYDGQLSGPARQAGLDIQGRTRDVKTSLKGDSESLEQTARVFEEVDNQTIESFSKSQESLLLSGILGIVDVWSKGSAYLGYNDDPSTNTLIICMYCVCRKINETDENKEIRERYKAAVDAYNKAREDMWVAYDAYLIAFAVWAALVATTIAAGASGNPIALATFAKVAAAYAAMETALVAYKKCIERMNIASDEAAAAWNLLPGDNRSVDGDDATSPYDPRPCSDQKVYEP